MNTIAALPPSVPTLSPRHRTIWAVGVSALLHVLVLSQLPWPQTLWQRLLKPPPAAPQLQVELQPVPSARIKPSPPQAEPAPKTVPEKPAITPEAPPTAPPASSTRPSLTEAPRAVPAEIITAKPGANDLNTWEWRDALLQDATRLAPPAQPPQTTRDGLPQNWEKPLIPDTRSWLDAYIPPGELKQQSWADTDGTRRFETVLPNGTRLCGQAAPADPLQPLSFSLPLWHTCGKVRGSQQALTRDDPFRRGPPRATPDTDQR